MSNRALLQFAISIESAANSIYLAFKKQFSDLNPETSSIWAQLADDEAKHAAELQKILDSLPKEQLEAPADEKALKILERINLDLDKAKDRAFTKTKTLKDAYEFTHELEHSEVNALFEFCTTSLVPCEEWRKKIIISLVTEHLARLEGLSELI
jgi:rubrerythrin